MAHKEFHTKSETINDTEIRYIADEDFIEMGSISGCQFFNALMFCRLHSREHSPYLWQPHWKFVKKSIQSFCQEFGLDISQKYPSFRTTGAKMYQLPDQNGYHSLLVTIFNDYRTVWVRIEEVSHQTFYVDHQWAAPFVDSAQTILHGIRKAEQLKKRFPNPNKERR